MKSTAAALPNSIELLIGNGAAREVPWDDFYPLSESSNAKFDLLYLVFRTGSVTPYRLEHCQP
jgi:hypothetical protein